MRLTQILAIGLAVALQQRQARGNQAQLEVLAQEEHLARREQRCFGVLGLFDALDADQLLEFGPQVATELLPVGGRGDAEPALDDRLRARALLEGKRQAVGHADHAFQFQRYAGDIGERQRLEAVDIAIDQLAQRQQLRLRGARQMRIGGLQGDQRRLDIAGQLQLLGGNRNRLLDLGQQTLVAAARQLLIHAFKRHLLCLRFGHVGFQRAGLGGESLQHLLVLLRQGAAFVGDDFAGTQAFG